MQGEEPRDHTLIQELCRHCGLQVAQCGCSSEPTWEKGNTPYGNHEESAREQDNQIIGSLIDGRYLVHALIGRGGMGAVYRAEHVGIGKRVAIKLLAKSITANPSAALRFSQESKAVGGLSHENIVGVSDNGFTADGTPFLVMDFLDGQSLERVLRKEGHIEPSRAMQIFSQIANGLAHSHARGIVHRDLKPSNFILVRGDHDREIVKVVDFGIAKLASQMQQSITIDGEIFGSPPYMSPEQSTGQPIDMRSDIYSLGCVMYEALTGGKPFHGASATLTLIQQASRTPEPFKTRAADLPPIPASLEAIVFKCLEKHPDDRFQTMKELSSAILAIKDKKPPGKDLSTGTRKVFYAALSVSAVVLLVAAVSGHLNNFAPGQKPVEENQSTATPIRPVAEAALTAGERKAVQEWTSFDLLAQDAVNEGSYEKARPLYNKSMELAASLRASYRLSTLEGLSDLNELTGRSDRALSTEIDQLAHRSMDFESAIKTLDGAADQAGALAAIEHANKLALLLNNNGRFAETRKLITAALSTCRRCLPPDHEMIARSLLALAESFRYSGFIEGKTPEIDYRVQAYEIASKHGRGELFEECAYTSGNYYRTHGQPALAVPYLKEARDAAEKTFGASSAQTARCCFQLALSYRAQHQVALEQDCLKGAITILQTCDRDQIDADALYLQALYSQQCGNQDESISNYTKCLALQQTGPLKNYPRIARSLFHLIEQMPDVSLRKRALLRRRITILKRVNNLDENDECHSCMLIANGYALHNQPLKEQEYLQRAVEITTQQSPHHFGRREWIQAARNLGISYRDHGQIKEAERNALLFKSWALEESGPDTLDSAEADILLASIYLRTHRNAEAENLLVQARSSLTACKPGASDRDQWRDAMKFVSTHLPATGKVSGAKSEGDKPAEQSK